MLETTHLGKTAQVEQSGNKLRLISPVKPQVYNTYKYIKVRVPGYYRNVISSASSSKPVEKTPGTENS